MSYTTRSIKVTMGLAMTEIDEALENLRSTDDEQDSEELLACGE